MKTTVKTFKDLIVWQKSHQLVLDIYHVSKNFPDIEKFGLMVQIRKSASSVPTNIVEGHKRKTRKDFLHFLNIADSSLEETKYHLLLSKDLNYINFETYERLLIQSEEVSKMLYGLQKSLNA